METNQDHRRHTSAERVEWLTREKLQANDRAQLDELDRQRVVAMRSLSEMDEISTFKRVFDYAVAEFVSSKLFDGNSKEDRHRDALDLATIRQLLDDVETLHLKEEAITEPYMQRWRSQNSTSANN
jgi:hypothetical protein